MSILQYLINPIKNIFNYSSRASRKEYWYFFSFFFIIFLLTACFSAYLSFLMGSLSLNETNSGFNITPSFAFVSGVLIFLSALQIPIYFMIVSLGARRLHDVNKSGKLQYLLLLPFIFFYITGIIIHDLSSIFIGMSIFIFTLVLIYIFLIFYFAIAGQVGENQYGPDPKEVEIVKSVM